ncbi:MAG: cytochrome ubiquinol oxidase subunit I [Rubrobacteraceae bacterium]|nr:cytochrome ubiquinol oxidase subunit I [Rubrobacteraceae bacterium]
MNDPVLISRLQFAFTVMYHYLFPGLTMGLAFLIFLLKSIYMRNGDERYNRAVRFWGKIFAVTFILGVVSGIPMEFQFGTNWAAFSKFAGGIIAQTLAMEGAFAFFLESAFVGVFLFGERAFGQRLHWLSSFLVFLGTWASAYFILCTNSWLQNPVGYKRLPGGGIDISNYWQVLFNPWVFVQFIHNQGATVLTAAIVMAGVGAFYVLSRRDEEYGKMFVKVGVIVGLIMSIWQIVPSGDLEGLQVTHKQPVKLASMEGLFKSERPAGIAILGQPDMNKQRLDNPIVVPRALSFLTYRSWSARVKGLDAFPKKDWPDNVPLVYYSYHIMVGLGTIFVAIMVIAAFLLWRRKLFESRWMLWILMLTIPFPSIATTAGWITAEVGRQPWLAYGLFRTSQGVSSSVSSGNVLFTLLGFAGIYLVMGLLYFILVVGIVGAGPEAEEAGEEPAEELPV